MGDRRIGQVEWHHFLMGDRGCRVAHQASQRGSVACQAPDQALTDKAAGAGNSD